MKALLLTREFPPEVYGGAGVHVEYLARELAKRIDLEVRCFGEPRDAPGVHAFSPWPELDDASSALRTMSVDLRLAAHAEGVDIVHSHTWYTIFGGHLTKLLHGVPHVVTTHSLEPMRPWKTEQLGAGGYALSSFCERTGIESADAVVAVSNAMRGDVMSAYPQVDPSLIQVVYNGIDTEQYQPDPSTDVLAEARHRPEPADRALRRPDHAAERDRASAGRRARDRPRARSSSSARGRPTSRRSSGRPASGPRRCARAAATSSGSRRCCRSPR